MTYLIISFKNALKGQFIFVSTFQRRTALNIFVVVPQRCCVSLSAANSSCLHVCPPRCDARGVGVSSDLLTASLGDVPVKILKDQRFCSVIFSVIPRSLLASATSTHKKKICCVDVSPAASSFLCSCSPLAVFC